MEKELEPLLKSPPAANAAKTAYEKYYKQLENVLIKLVNESKTDEERCNGRGSCSTQSPQQFNPETIRAAWPGSKLLETEITKRFKSSPSPRSEKFLAAHDTCATRSGFSGFAVSLVR